ncbi:N-acetylglucosamine-6-phosphate deacetylase [Luethyella okanaganae]|uniref:N-acetylglucosamine-6-phosphate deacetylase n=1 Tax=Luethyella okanaganae TaxID=69372 RepID=A0ABW1VGS7_9MICO
MTVIIHDATRLDADGIVEHFWLLAEGERILATGTGDGWRASAPHDAEITNAGGAWLTPGFIDLHCHGGGGYDFDHTAEGIEAALRMHRSHGTTRAVLSLIANPLSTLRGSLDVIAAVTDADPLVLGSHLEGPFLAKARRGAHNAEYLRGLDNADIDGLLAAARGTLRQVTLAPELPGALDAIDEFVHNGIVVAIGHTEASYATAREAFDRGARLLTHTFNGMPGIHHRAPGPIVAAFKDERITLELILDGQHVHPDVARIAFRSAPGRVALVTDAMAAAGERDGDYRLGSLNVTVRDGLAVLSGTSTIAGSTLTMDAALRAAVFDVGIDLVEAVTALTRTPARVLGRDTDFGTLAAGFAADAVLLDEHFAVQSVWAGGSPVAG